ncbi:MAG: hypothetical protein ABIJ61_08390 [bacterium]
MKLRRKVLIGFVVLALMLSVAGAWSIYELQSISTAVGGLLDDNYKSIAASKMMLEALEREDSGILLLILGKWSEGRQIVQVADSLFAEGFGIASSNLTIPGEAEYVADIESKYASYKAVWQRPIVDTEKQGNLNWYFESIHDSFLSVKLSVNELMTLNDRTMFETALSLRQKANRAIMPGIVAILAALVFSLMFSYFVNLYVVGPVVKINQGVRDFVAGKGNFDLQLETDDELADLADSVRTLTGRIGASGGGDKQ